VITGGKGHVFEVEDGKGRCGNVWRWKVFWCSCIHCGMMPMMSIMHVESGSPAGSDAQGCDCISIMHSKCVMSSGMYV
jgi:hypothetical protein